MLRVLLVLAAVLLMPKVSFACECIGVQGPFLRAGKKGLVAAGRVVPQRGSTITVYTRAEETACGYGFVQWRDYLIQAYVYDCASRTCRPAHREDVRS